MVNHENNDITILRNGLAHIWTLQ